MYKNKEKNNNWETPKDLYAELDAEFNFDFDPCPLFAEFDGLAIEWGYRNYINPPYSRKLKDAFVKRSITESKKGKLCVCLLPVRTSSILFHEHIKPNAKEIRFIKGRLCFIGTTNDGNKIDSKNKGNRFMHDSMIVVFDGREVEGSLREE
jgi:site-specific DNA-methyltransferase (adenine-specific)